MAPCDSSVPSSSFNGSGTSGMLQSSSLNVTSAPSPPPCGTSIDSGSSVVYISITVAAFIAIVLATAILVYVFRKLGWCVEIDPATERLRNLRESARDAKPSQGLDPAIIRSFPVYTFRDDKSGSRESTTESTGLSSLRRISREISRSLSFSRQISNDHVSISCCSTKEENSSVKSGISRCSTREENSSSGDEMAKESPCEAGFSRGEFVVTIQGDENIMSSLIGDSDALVANLTWACRRECAVCLGEYAAGERIKVVPACAHGFHADCIDLWLAAKTTCPICRRDLSPGESAAAAEGVTDGELAEGTGAEGMGATAAPAAEAAAEAAAPAAAPPATAAPAAETAVAANLVFSSSGSTASSSESTIRESSISSSSSSGDGE